MIYSLYKKGGNIYGLLTEIDDALNCLEKNVRDDTYNRRGSLHERVGRMARYLLNQPGGMDWIGAGKCMAEENIKDYIIGKMNEYARRITQNRNWVRPVGPGTGGWAGRRNTSIRMRSIK